MEYEVVNGVLGCTCLAIIVVYLFKSMNKDTQHYYVIQILGLVFKRNLIQLYVIVAIDIPILSSY